MANPPFFLPPTATRDGHTVNLQPDYGEWIQLRDGFPVFTRTWSVPQGTLLHGTVTFIHGLGEHIDRYDHLFPLLAEAGFQVHAYDQRGFGRTGLRLGTRKLGFTFGFDVALEDVKEAIERNTIQGKPRFLYGHSMGGIIVLEFLRKYGATVPLNGVISSSPAIASPPESRPSPILVWALRKIKPLVKSWLILNNAIDARGLCHDDAVISAYKQDPLVHPYISADHGDSILQTGELIDGLTAEQIINQYPNQVPLLLVHGSEDRITCPTGTAAFAEKAVKGGYGDVTLTIYQGMLHELHNEPEVSEKLLEQYVGWLSKQCALV